MPQPPAPNRPPVRRPFSMTAIRRAICVLAAALALAAPARAQSMGPDLIAAHVVDTSAGRLYAVTVTDIDSNNIAMSIVTPGAPRPWDTSFGPPAGPINASSDYGRLYIMMDGEYHIQGLDPATMGVVDTFSTSGHGDGVDFAIDHADSTLYGTTSTGEIISVDLTPGLTFGDLGMVASGLMTPMGIAVDDTDTYAYVAGHGTSEILRVELGSGMATVVATTTSPPRDVAVSDLTYMVASILDNGDLILVDGDPMSPGYGTITPVVSGLSDPTSVNIGSSAIDGVVVTEGGTGKLLAVDADPMSPGFGTIVTLASGLGTPGGAGLILIPGFVMLPCTTAPASGSSIAACLYGATGTTELGSYGGTLSWDPAKLSFTGWGAGDPPFDTPVVNTSNAASGMLAFSDAAAGGSTGTTHLLCADFDVIGARTGMGQTFPLNLTMTSAFDTGLTSLLPDAVVADSPMDIVAACTIGDPLDDGSVNSGDALAILRHELGITVPFNQVVTLQAGCGDLNADGLTDSTDSNIALSYEVGLSIDPNFPLMQSNVVMKTCAGGACAGQPVAPAAPPLPIGGLESASVVPVTATLRVDAGKILPGRPFDVVVEVDAGARSVGSFTAALSWDAGLAEMTAVSGGKANGLGSLTVNDTEAASGKLRFAAASPLGASGIIELARLTLTSNRALPHPEGIFTLKFTSMAAPGPRFESLLHELEIAPLAGANGRP